MFPRVLTGVWSRISCAFLLVFATALRPPSAWAQCLNWGTDFSQVGPTGIVYAITSWDDGSGPALFIGGDFGGSVGLPAAFVAKWNGSAWTALRSGTDDQVQAFEVFDDGTGPALFAGGTFANAGGLPAGAVAKWNGTNWSSLGSGLVYAFGPHVKAMTVFDDGTGPALFVGGFFSGASGVGSEGVIKWDGANWTSVGGGVHRSPPPGVGYAMAVYDDGTGPALYVGGNFTLAGNVPANHVARWNGTSWAALDVGSNNVVFTLVTYDDGTGPALYAGGSFNSIGGVSTVGIAKWNGTSWSAIGGVNHTVLDLRVFDDGNGSGLYAGGAHTNAGGVAVRRISRWDGVRWSALGYGFNASVQALGVHDDGQGGGADLYAGGAFTQTAAFSSRTLARWHGCSGPIDAICFGDATVAPCPCSNTGSAGRGCQNSDSTGGALLTSSGTLSPDTLVLQVSGETATALTIFLQGNSLVSASAIFGDGLRCAGGALKRLYVKPAGAGAADAPEPSDPWITARSAALGDPIAPGSIRYYQTYYRDSDPGFCPSPTGSTFNSSNGLRVVWP